MNIKCPGCGRDNDRQGHPSGEKPTAGDMSICWSCGCLAIFTGPTSMRLPTDEERADLEADSEIKRAKAAMAESYRPLEAIELLRGTQ